MEHAIGFSKARESFRTSALLSNSCFPSVLPGKATARVKGDGPKGGRTPEQSHRLKGSTPFSRLALQDAGNLLRRQLSYSKSQR